MCMYGDKSALLMLQLRSLKKNMISQQSVLVNLFWDYNFAQHEVSTL